MLLVIILEFPNASSPPTELNIPKKSTVRLFLIYGDDIQSSFLRFMSGILRGLDCCVCYIDDILEASETADKHMLHIRMLFKLIGSSSSSMLNKLVCGSKNKDIVWSTKAEVFPFVKLNDAGTSDTRQSFNLLRHIYRKSQTVCSRDATSNCFVTSIPRELGIMLRKTVGQQY